MDQVGLHGGIQAKGNLFKMSRRPSTLLVSNSRFREYTKEMEAKAKKIGDVLEEDLDRRSREALSFHRNLARRQSTVGAYRSKEVVPPDVGSKDASILYDEEREYDRQKLVRSPHNFPYEPYRRARSHPQWHTYELADEAEKDIQSTVEDVIREHERVEKISTKDRHLMNASFINTVNQNRLFANFEGRLKALQHQGEVHLSPKNEKHTKDDNEYDAFHLYSPDHTLHFDKSHNKSPSSKLNFDSFKMASTVNMVGDAYFRRNVAEINPDTIIIDRPTKDIDYSEMKSWCSEYVKSFSPPSKENKKDTATMVPKETGPHHKKKEDIPEVAESQAIVDSVNRRLDDIQFRIQKFLE